MRNIKTRRNIILVVTALALVIASVVYVVVPRGVRQMDLITAEGEIVTDTLEIYVGTETRLTCKVVPDIFSNRKVTYVTADEKIATVDETGRLKALKEGETLLTVDCGGARKNYTVKAETAVEDIKGLDNEITLYEGDEFQLEPKIKMAEKGLEKPEVTYKVKRNTIATVDKKGLITAVKEGKTTVTVTAGNVTKKVKVIVEAAVVETYTPVVTANDNDDNDTNNNKKKTRKAGKKNGGNNGGNNGGDTGGNAGGDGGNAGGNTGGDTGGNTSGEGSNTSGSTGGNTGGGSTEAAE